MIANIRFMKQAFQRFNHEYFQDSLPTPTFKISRSTKNMGTCARFPRVLPDGTPYYSYVISCSKYFFCALEEHENTMLHEMCHLWVFINYPNTTEPSHGPIWKSIAERVTIASNYKYVIAEGSTGFVIHVNKKKYPLPKTTTIEQYPTRSSGLLGFIGRNASVLNTLLLIILLISLLFK